MAPDILQAIAQQAEQQDWDEHLADMLADPTTDKLQGLYDFGQRMGGLGDAMANYSPGQRVRNLGAATDVAGLLNAGHIDAALANLKERRSMLERAGESTEITDNLIADVDSDDPDRLNRARAVAGMVIGMTLGEKAPEVLERLGFGKSRASMAEEG